MGGVNDQPERANLERKCAQFFNRPHALALGRGTWVIALILEAIKSRVRNKIVALPSFVCHTPLAAIIQARWQPLFCDVDPATGLVPDSEWLKAAEMGASAFIFVHLFGNPAKIDVTKKLCQQKGVFLIEDACQAVGAMLDGQPCGSFGDASVLSFGHTKSIDVGSGGMLLTDDAELAFVVAKLASEHEYLSEEEFNQKEGVFSSFFYARKAALLAQLDNPTKALSGLIDQSLDTVASPWAANAARISDKLERLAMIASERRRKANLYTTLLAETDIIPIGMHKDSVPWRYCFRIVGISKVRQEALSSELRAVGVHVSNWYLPTHWMVAPTYLATGELRGTEQLASEIFQLWLDDSTDDAQIHANAMAIRKLLDR